VTPVVIDSVYDYRLFSTELRPSDGALLADAAALIVVDHDAVADPRSPRIHLRPNCRDYAARFMSSDDRASDLFELEINLLLGAVKL